MKAIKEELRLIPLLFIMPVGALLAVKPHTTDWEKYGDYAPVLAGFAVLAIGAAVALKLGLIDR